jgi:hypothetical protein
MPNPERWSVEKLRAPFVSALVLFILPGLLFVAIAMLVAQASLKVALPGTSEFKAFWELLGSIGDTLSGIGTLFLALAVGASLATFFTQFLQLGLQQQQAKESREQLLETVKIQAENLKVLERQAAAALLAAQIQSLTSRFQVYEGQIGMVRARAMNSMTAERRTEEDPNVLTMRDEQEKLSGELDRILKDLKTKLDPPPKGTSADPFAST